MAALLCMLCETGGQLPLYLISPACGSVKCKGGIRLLKVAYSNAYSNNASKNHGLSAFDNWAGVDQVIS